MYIADSKVGELCYEMYCSITRLLRRFRESVLWCSLPKSSDWVGDVHSHLIVAKTKAASLQPTTIPKLELYGALLVTKLIMNVSKYFNCEHNINLWTDSAIVLGWLQRKPQTLKTFVANRISNIQSLVNTSQWKYINTNENPADIGSRGCSPQELQQNQLWWQGPHWLRLPQDQWPPPRSFEPTNIEVKVSQNFTIVSSEDITSRFSTLNRCLRVVSYIFRFVNKCQLKSKQFSKIIEATEIDFVIKRLIMLAQQTYYKREIENLQQGKSINCKSSILTLNPFLAEDGLLRVGGFQIQTYATTKNIRYLFLLNHIWLISLFNFRIQFYYTQNFN